MKHDKTHLLLLAAVEKISKAKKYHSQETKLKWYDIVKNLLWILSEEISCAWWVDKDMQPFCLAFVVEIIQHYIYINLVSRIETVHQKMIFL